MPAAARRPGPVVVLGDVVTDVLVRPRGPLAYASDTSAAITVQPGGSGANLAAWLAHLGVEAHLVARVGDDPFGQHQAAELRRAGVTPHLVVEPGRATRLIVILVDATGERSMLTDREANFGLAAADVPAALLRRGGHLHVSGYLLLAAESRPGTLEALRRARAAGMTTSVDPSSAALLRQAGPSAFLAWSHGADLCLPNLDEGRVLSGEEEPSRVARALSTAYGEVALKRGAEGAVWSAVGRPLVRVPAEPAEVLDATGAGDAFGAGFLAAWLRDGTDAHAALAAGAALAARAVARTGARPPHNGGGAHDAPPL